MSDKTRAGHLESMSRLLYAIANYQGKVEYATQLSEKTGIPAAQVALYVTTLRDSGHIRGRLIQPGSSLVSRKQVNSGIQLTITGYAHVDENRQSLHVMTSQGKTLGDEV